MRVCCCSIVTLCEALQRNSSLVRLDLSNNVITDRAAPAVHDLLKLSATLREVSLRWTSLRGHACWLDPPRLVLAAGVVVGGWADLVCAMREGVVEEGMGRGLCLYGYTDTRTIHNPNPNPNTNPPIHRPNSYPHSNQNPNPSTNPNSNLNPHCVDGVSHVRQKCALHL
jgi:hypothetical protein